jgi:hypothetical protein
MEGFENPGRSHLGNGEVGSAADDDIIFILYIVPFMSTLKSTPAGTKLAYQV